MGAHGGSEPSGWRARNSHNGSEKGRSYSKCPVNYNVRPRPSFRVSSSQRASMLRLQGSTLMNHPARRCEILSWWLRWSCSKPTHVTASPTTVLPGHSCGGGDDEEADASWSVVPAAGTQMDVVSNEQMSRLSCGASCVTAKRPEADTTRDSK